MKRIIFKNESEEIHFKDVELGKAIFIKDIDDKIIGMCVGRGRTWVAYTGGDLCSIQHYDYLEDLISKISKNMGWTFHVED